VATEQAGILLVFGSPGHGKSKLSEALETKHGFYRIDVDAVYVRFIRGHYPSLCPPNIEQVIMSHYDDVFSRQDAHRRHWHTHFLEQIVAAAVKHPRVVVEGYLLGDCRTSFDRALTDQGHEVHHIRAEWHTYTEVGPGLTMEEVAGLCRA
jgi:hypothetical protein